MSLQNRKKSGLISSVVVCAVLLIVAYTVVFYRQNIIDQITVWQFKPTVEVSALVDRAGMNSTGKFYYLASQPKLDSVRDRFNSECDRKEQTASILGCYSNSKIFIWDVTDKQLDGIREVTATHETLHAIYARMSNDEKKQVSALIETEYKKLLNDKDFVELMSFYARTEPGQRDNELHSIIGTEVSDISPELEEYYSKYFSDRKKVVYLNAKYGSVFKSLKKRADDLSLKLDTLSSGITTTSKQYNDEISALNNDIASFNNRANSGDFISQAQFYNERSALTRRLSEAELMKANIDESVNQYKILLDEYNSIASQSKKLYSVIDSTLPPVPAQIK